MLSSGASHWTDYMFRLTEKGNQQDLKLPNPKEKSTAIKEHVQTDNYKDLEEQKVVDKNVYVNQYN
jgi:hypothetical protein